MTWRDFGWRLHSRLGVDFRKKGAEARRRLYSFQDIYVTLIKLDLMCVGALSGRVKSHICCCASPQLSRISERRTQRRHMSIHEQARYPRHSGLAA